MFSTSITFVPSGTANIVFYMDPKRIVIVNAIPCYICRLEGRRMCLYGKEDVLELCKNISRIECSHVDFDPPYIRAYRKTLPIDKI